MATNGQELDECSNCRATQSTDGTPLSTCAKCHSRKYCSRTCQAERWPFHKTFCGKTPIQAVDDRSPPTEQMRGYGIVTTPLPSLSPEYHNVCGHHMCTSAPSSWVHNAPVWTDVPISTAVGMPMHMLAAPVTSALRAFTNGTVNALGIDIDPTSATFGEIHWASNQPPMGECLLVRVDGRTFHMTHIMALYRYAREGLGAIKAATKQEAAGKTVDRQALVERYLSPKGFKIFFEEMKAAEIGSDPTAWEGVECPVEVV